MSRIAAYIRVSTEEQTKGFGLAEQRNKLLAYCDFKGWKNVTWFEDPGFSGGSLKRPGLKKLLKGIQAGKFDVVITYKADRLSRSLKDLLVLIEDEMAPRDVAFVSVTEDFNSHTATGKMFLSMLGMFAEFERNTIRDRTLGGRKQKARGGGYAAGEPALGYKSVDGCLQVDEAQAQIVRQIFAWSEAGVGLTEIANELNKIGASTKRGGDWHPSTVFYILRNPKYKGMLNYSFKDEEFSTANPSLAIITSDAV